MACGFPSSKAERPESQHEKAKAENAAPPFQKADAPGKVVRAVKDAVETVIDRSAYLELPDDVYEESFVIEGNV